MMMVMMMMMMMQISSDDGSRDIMSHMARNVTVWEFINMRVNRSLQRPNAKIRIADMLNELEELHRQYRKLARDELRPMPCDTDQPCPASKILVVSAAIYCHHFTTLCPKKVVHQTHGDNFISS